MAQEGYPTAENARVLLDVLLHRLAEQRSAYDRQLAKAIASAALSVALVAGFITLGAVLESRGAGYWSGAALQLTALVIVLPFALSPFSRGKVLGTPEADELFDLASTKSEPTYTMAFSIRNALLGNESDLHEIANSVNKAMKVLLIQSATFVAFGFALLLML